jgi:nucleotide-binding universal stress UspA family protein
MIRLERILMLFGSTTQHVVRHAECPVLTISEGS